MSVALAPAAASRTEWKRWPQTEAFIDRVIDRAIEGNSFAANLAERMIRETGTHLKVWVDHLVVSGSGDLARTLATLGYERQPMGYSVGVPAYAHPGGIFPRIAVAPSSASGDEDGFVGVGSLAIKVESIAAFSRAHDLGLEIQGYPQGPYRTSRVGGERTDLIVTERRGYLGFEPFPGELAREGRMRPHAARDALAARDLWLGRRRRFDDDAEGFDVTEATLQRVIELAGSRDLACHLIFEVERDYWQSRNRAAQVQKARQDRLGLGWANHDHHTFRCSRRFFPRVIGMFTTLGFELRERFHAGEHAGWGAQVLEHPTTGIVIFADLDLAADEASQDFAHQALADLPRPGTVGPLGGAARRVDPGGRDASSRGSIRLRRPARRPESRGRHRDHGSVLRFPVPAPGVHRRRALARRAGSAPIGPGPGMDRRRNNMRSS